MRTATNFYRILPVILALSLGLSGCSGTAGSDDNDDDDGGGDAASISSCSGDTLTDFSNSGMSVEFYNNDSVAATDLPEVTNRSSDTVGIDCSSCGADTNSAGVQIFCSDGENDATVFCTDGYIAGLINLDPIQEGVCVAGYIECSGGFLTTVCENP